MLKNKINASWGLGCSLLCVIFGLYFFAGCSSREQILIYTSMEDYRMEYLNERLQEEFPEYDIILDYLSTGNHAARLLAEGTHTPCDITYDLEYSYLHQLEQQEILADVARDYDMTLFCEDTLQSSCFIVENRTGGAIIVNTEVLRERNLPEPAKYCQETQAEKNQHFENH